MGYIEDLYVCMAYCATTECKSCEWNGTQRCKEVTEAIEEYLGTKTAQAILGRK